jgi:hypothetical protein
MADDISALQHNLLHSSAQAQTVLITKGLYDRPAYVFGIDITTPY